MSLVEIIAKALAVQMMEKITLFFNAALGECPAMRWSAAV
jgi:hypothetical protein